MALARGAGWSNTRAGGISDDAGLQSIVSRRCLRKSHDLPGRLIEVISEKAMESTLPAKMRPGTFH
jgi:hypothetical protein